MRKFGPPSYYKYLVYGMGVHPINDTVYRTEDEALEALVLKRLTNESGQWGPMTCVIVKAAYDRQGNWLKKHSEVVHRINNGKAWFE